MTVSKLTALMLLLKFAVHSYFSSFVFSKMAEQQPIYNSLTFCYSYSGNLEHVAILVFARQSFPISNSPNILIYSDMSIFENFKR